MIAPATLDALKQAAGPGGWIAGDSADALPYLADWRGRVTGRAALVLRPSTVEAVAAIVRTANQQRLSLVPQGGNTGLVLGGIPDASGDECVLSTDRMTRIRQVDADDFSLVAEAGCILADVQAAARAVDRGFPLSLAAEGSARIGGLVSTNAGGVHVVRHGVMRSLVLGLEAVLPTGAVVADLAPLRKNNTGYDLKQLLIGAEGTLGVVTAATLRLAPATRTRVTAFIGLGDPAGAIRLLARLQGATGGQVAAFELIPRAGLDLVLATFADLRDPLAQRHSAYILTDIESSRVDPGLDDLVEAELADALARGWIADAALARHAGDAAAFWRLRELLPEAEKREGQAIKHDVAVPVAAMAAFIADASDAVERLTPGARVLAFGHLGDGNVHFNVRRPLGMELADFLPLGPAISRLVHDIATDMGGTISAEHGIGLAKRDELQRTADPARLDAMRAIRRALDPNGVFNPGRLFRA